MAFYYKSEAEVQPVAPPDGESPPLVIWGPDRSTPNTSDCRVGSGKWSVAQTSGDGAAPRNMGRFWRGFSDQPDCRTSVGVGQSTA